MFRLIDTHAHLDEIEDLEPVLAGAKKAWARAEKGLATNRRIRELLKTPGAELSRQMDELIEANETTSRKLQAFTVGTVEGPLLPLERGDLPPDADAVPGLVTETRLLPGDDVEDAVAVHVAGLPAHGAAADAGEGVGVALLGAGAVGNAVAGDGVTLADAAGAVVVDVAGLAARVAHEVDQQRDRVELGVDVLRRDLHHAVAVIVVVRQSLLRDEPPVGVAPAT